LPIPAPTGSCRDNGVVVALSLRRHGIVLNNVLPESNSERYPEFLTKPAIGTGRQYRDPGTDKKAVGFQSLAHTGFRPIPAKI
jgi:hypothetical protein